MSESWLGLGDLQIDDDLREALSQTCWCLASKIEEAGMEWREIVMRFKNEDNGRQFEVRVLIKVVERDAIGVQ